MTKQEIADDYKASLCDLKDNSKPMITVLTMIAEENKQHAEAIVQVIETRILEVSINCFFL